MSHVTLQNS